MIPKSGNRFSEKIMLSEKLQIVASGFFQRPALRPATSQ